MKSGYVPRLRFDVSSEQNGVQFTQEVSRDTVRIGCLSSSDLSLPGSQGVARMHAVIEAVGPQEIYIIDLGSAAGTVVNGNKVNKCPLKTDDLITIGNFSIRLRIGDAESERVGYRDAAPVPPVSLTDSKSGSAFVVRMECKQGVLYYNGVIGVALGASVLHVTLASAVRACAGAAALAGVWRVSVIEIVTTLREVTQAECRAALLAEVEGLVSKVGS